MCGVYDPHIKIFRYASGSFLVNWAPKEILAFKYYALGSKNFPAKKLNILILKIYIFFPFPPLTSPRYCSPTSYPPLTSRWYFSISYQMSLLLLLDPGGLNCWTLGCWAVVLSTRSCWKNNFNFGTSIWFMRLRNFNRKFSKSKSLRAVGFELLNFGLLGRRLIH